MSEQDDTNATVRRIHPPRWATTPPDQWTVPMYLAWLEAGCPDVDEPDS